MLNEHNPTKWSGTQGLQSLEVLQTSRILNASNRNDMKDMENQQRKYTLVRKPRLGLQKFKKLKIILFCFEHAKKSSTIVRNTISQEQNTV